MNSGIGWTHDKVTDSAYEAWLELYTDTNNTTPGDRGGIPGQVWTGNLNRAIRDACDLPAEYPDAVQTIIHELLRAGNLAMEDDPHSADGPHIPGMGSENREQTVWIPDTWRSPSPGPERSGASNPPTTAGASGHTTPASSAPSSAPSAAGSDRRRGKRVTTFSCRHCAFVGLTEHSLRTHENQLQGRAHPTGRYACPMCPAVYTTAVAASTHARRDHQVLGRICWPCSRVFPDRDSWARHRKTEHSGTEHPPAENPADNSAPAGSPPQGTPVTGARPEISADVRTELEAIRQAVRTLIQQLE